MNALRHDVQNLSAKQGNTLRLPLDRYFIECFIKAGTMDQETKNFIEALIDLWPQNDLSAQHTLGSNRRKTVLMIAGADEMSTNARLECLRQFSLFSHEFIADFRQVLDSAETKPDESCVNLARFLAGSLYSVHKDLACWSHFLLHWCTERETSLLNYTIETLTIDEWFQWSSDVQLIFPNLSGGLSSTEGYPIVLQPVMHAWANRIKPYRSTIKSVESILGLGPPSQCFRTWSRRYAKEVWPRKYSEVRTIRVLGLLHDEIIHKDNEKSHPTALQATLAFLKWDCSNVIIVFRALQWLSKMTSEETDVYLRIIAIYQGPTPAIALVLLAEWVENLDLGAPTRIALECLVGLLEIHLLSDTAAALNASCVNEYISNELMALNAEAERLSVLRRSLKLKDPEGTSALCLKLGIGNNASALEDKIAGIPSDLINVIEMIDDDTVELDFPLSHLTALQRGGLGTGNAQSLIVRLAMGELSSVPLFCIHLDIELGKLDNSGGHSPWLFNAKGTLEETKSCCGQMNRATYHLRGTLESYLHCGLKTVKGIYEMLKRSLDCLLETCITCGNSHGVRLHRPTPCKNISCRRLFVHPDRNFQLNDLKEDPQVADLLFTVVQTALSSGNPALLPDRGWNKFKPWTEALDKIATLAILSRSEGWTNIDYADKSTLPILRFILLEYNGFLVSATGRVRTPSPGGQIRIPNMPGAHQFLLANAAPHLEKAFAIKKGTGPTTVVFHGTSMDRLYAILCDGLKVLSNTPLQKNGAVRGKGIYVAEEPSTAWGYASQHVSPRTGKGWASHTFDCFHVLLACEALGVVKGGDVHVIKDPETLILRYIFLTPSGMRAPLAAHIVPAIASVCNSLRSGAL
jgi:hypothetical protein